MRVFEFTVLDKPTPMGRKRARVTTAGGATFYPETKDVRALTFIRQAFNDAYPDELPIQAKTPVSLSVQLWHRCPSTMSRKRRIAAWMRPVVTTKPDLNNVINNICDALSGYAYVDDSQITVIEDCKMYYAIDKEGNDTQPRMRIIVEEI